MHPKAKVNVKVHNGNPVVMVLSPRGRASSSGIDITLRHEADRPLVEAILAQGVTDAEIEELVAAMEADRAANGDELPSEPGPAVLAWVQRVSLRIGGFANLAAVTAVGNVISTLILRHYGVGAT